MPREGLNNSFAVFLFTRLVVSPSTRPLVVIGSSLESHCQPTDSGPLLLDP